MLPAGDWRGRVLGSHQQQRPSPLPSSSNNVSLEFVRDDTLPIITRRSRTFQRTETTHRFRVKHNLASCTSPLDVEADVDNFYRQFLDETLANADPSDIYSIYINSNTLNAPIFLHPARVHKRDDEAFLNALYEVSQSNSSFLTHGELIIQLNIVKNVRGGGKTFKAPQSTDVSRAKLIRSLVMIDATIGFCFLRSLALCIYHKERYVSDKRKIWFNIKSDNARQLQLVKELVTRYNIEEKEMVDLDDLKIIQSLVEDYKITVVDRFNWRNIIFRGGENGPTLYIEFDSGNSSVGHYNPIINMKGYIGRSHFCEKCHIGSNNRSRHRCRNSCKYCLAPDKCEDEMNKMHCSDCEIIFPSNSCFNRHKDTKICGRLKRCNLCDTEYITRFGHECSANRCEKCDLNVNFGHSCFIKPLDMEKLIQEDEVPRIFVFFDVESFQREDQSLESSDLIHMPMLLISRTLCNYCISSETCNKIYDPCPFCGEGTSIFWGLQCIETFTDHLYHSLAPKVEKEKGYITVFAHNGKGYDFHFILRDLFKRSFKSPDVMMNGNKIMHIQIGNVAFVDSLLFFGQSLASLPKAFGIANKVIKGFFPHDFNQPGNWDYIGPYPDQKFFKPEMMKMEIFNEFNSWYREKTQSNENFNFKQELMKYCENDVEILASCCLIFRQQFLSLNGVDPFTRCFTIAQVGLELLRTLYLSKNTLAVTPKSGYTNLRKCSRESLAWLDFQQRNLDIKIDREYRIGSFFADGYSKELNTVFEYLGCYFHGCPRCFQNDRDVIHELHKDSLNSRYLKVGDKLAYYRSRGLNVISTWGCEVRGQMSTDEDFREYIKDRLKYWYQVHYFGHADVKESFFGGRTNNIRFYHKCGLDEEIKYMDVNSLYPYVLKTKSYPVGHPHVINENFDSSLKSYFGFVKCRILPPVDLYIPILPTRISKKLVFTLCKTCAESCTETCAHNEKDRSLVGTWTTVELQAALVHGYRILDIFEVLHYKESSSTIFSGYIDKFLKIKHESSGWPQWCTDEGSKERFIQDVMDREDIKLDESNIMKNPALRFIAKLLLNSLWGKLAQSPDKKRVEIIHDYDSYMKKLTDNQIRITSEIMVNDNTLLLQYKSRDEFLEYGSNTSLAVASFVTSYARLELFNYMKEIESIRPGSLIYFDTDSLVYSRKLADREIESGDHLGQLKDEILSDYGSGASIQEFVTCGPKNYAFNVRLADGTIKSKIKTKGITLNKATLQFINYDFMIDAAKKYSRKDSGERSAKVPQFNIVVDSHHNLITKYFSKAYRVVSEKRIVQNNITFPYGFKGDRSKYHHNQ
ncbi:uncharacterized protein LOC141857628 [Brevipalpus obovatus]|uniref:uncharacterized protein LOC141851584 n=1 Tax=Brevipalpus obovatus TaxID=246614 RepID=UPI003D9F4077